MPRGAPTLSVDHLRDLFDEAPEPYLLTDAEGTIVDANEAAAALLGSERASMRGRRLPDLVAEDERSSFRERLAAIASQGERAEFDALVRRSVGSERQVSVLVRPRRAAPGEPAKLRIMLRDVTARREAELELRALNAKLEERVAERTAALEEANRRTERVRRHMAALLDRLQHGVILVDRELEVEFANSAAERFLASAGVREGKPLPETSQLPLRELALALFDREEPITEVPLGRVDAERTFSIGGIPAAGSSTVVLVVSDISDRERRERAEQDFITNAAHELQTPLTAIASATEVLQSGAKELPEQRDRFLGHIEREAARLARLTRGLLLLARAQALGEQPRADEVRVADVLDTVRRELSVPAGVRVDVVCEPDLGVYATRELLEQAVGELATNALKHTEHGAIALTAERTGSNGVVVTVSDTGSGFASAESDRVLDRFYRASGRQGEGFGLGLSIVDQIVAALGGEIALSSEPGSGTTARMILKGAGTPRS